MVLRLHHALYAVAAALSVTVGLTAAAQSDRSAAASAKKVPAATRARPEKIAPRIVAVPRSAEPKWKARHGKIADAAKKGADVVLLGDSITQGWEHVDVWENSFPGLRTLNAGISSDRVEHLLWRVRHGALGTGAAAPKAVVILIGVNNLAVSSPEHIAAGVETLIAEVKARAPETKILLVGLLPTGKAASHARRPKIAAVNGRLAELADGERVRYVDFGRTFLEADGSIAKTTMFDYLHLTRKGYERWATAMAPELNERLN